ncbi:MAG: DNA repair exonuclease [Actinomycetota bacterium]|nr:DNA repair exonuclease [Actinomycetota bacterium]
MTGVPRNDRRRPARLLHTSDCHLARDEGGPAQLAFQAVVNLAIARRVDVLLIAGDLFDHSRVGPEIVLWVADQLNRFPGSVVLLIGNHDCLDDASVHHRHDLRQVCDRLFMLDDPDGASVDLPGSDITVWGRAMVEHAPEFQPLFNAPVGRADRWSVIAAHGLLDAEAGRSSPIRSSELADLTADYVALGHIHVHTVVRENPPIRYSGAPHAYGSGGSGCVVVDFISGEGAIAEWVSTDDYVTVSPELALTHLP